MINFQNFCDDYSIQIAKSGKHHRPGWINFQCPFCAGHAGFHGGVNIQKSYYNCHRCGFHSMQKLIVKLIGVNYHEAKNIIKKYSTSTNNLQTTQHKAKLPSQIKLPGTKLLTKKAKQYLINRKFNPDKLASTWGLLSTSHTGFYKNRILAPIYQNHKLVSYQCRDITGKGSQKYLACHQDEEIKQHQHCIYGLDHASDNCIIVEGITDVWRLGIGAVATFGISFTKQQAQLIAMNFKRAFIMFDSDPQAQEQADQLGFLINAAFTNYVEIVNLPFLIDDIDPGDLSQDIADEIMKEIGL